MSATPFMTTLVANMQVANRAFTLLDASFPGTAPVADTDLFETCKCLACVINGEASVLDLASAWKARRAMQAMFTESTKAAA